VSQRGSHQKWSHPNGRQVIVAMHGSKPIPIGTLKSTSKAAAWPRMTFGKPVAESLSPLTLA